MSEIYVTGGELRRSLFRPLKEWQSSRKAVIIRFDPETKSSRMLVNYASPPEVCAQDLPAILFKSASLAGGKLYTCTSTEVLVYSVPDFRLLHYVSLPCFNDLHHVCPTHEGNLLVVSTGLDLVVEVTLEGRVIREWNVLGEDPWARFSRDIDYRTVASTKPHRSHPNHVFLLEDEIWVTRHEQRDAISLTHPGRRIDIAVQRPHDGFRFGNFIYFTTVDGKVVLANSRTLHVETIHDLVPMSGPAEQLLGWCRGVLPLDDRFAWVGFTRVRPTKFRESLSWIKKGPTYEQVRRPTHLALYDLYSGKIRDEIPLEPHSVGVVFSLLAAP
jgi:hypothetical protein